MSALELVCAIDRASEFLGARRKVWLRSNRERLKKLAKTRRELVNCNGPVRLPPDMIAVIADPTRGL